VEVGKRFVLPDSPPNYGKEFSVERKEKNKIILMGTVLGALTGAAAAFVLIKRAESEHTKPKLSPGEGLQVGLGLLGLLRLIAGFGED